ncbi:hypothetical protein Q3G72_029059 [Acer saccharum]|nr:hypothetical protein Q3G72_029059 [Acer saccharum]
MLVDSDVFLMPPGYIAPQQRADTILGISYGELFLIIGAAAALVGPKDLPMIARTAGRLAGRAIGYVQLARRQFDNVMQQSQARQAIGHEIRSVSFINPGPVTQKLIYRPLEPTINLTDNSSSEKSEGEQRSTNAVMKDYTLKLSGSINIHSQATAYAKLAESEDVKCGSSKSSVDRENFNIEDGPFTILPLSAESTGMLPNCKESVKGSDILLEAVIEAVICRLIFSCFFFSALKVAEASHSHMSNYGLEN